MRRDLGDGLVLRLATAADATELIDFNAGVQGDDDFPGEAIADWTRDLFELPHPTFRLDDVTVVEDTATGRIVSALFLIAQVWSYAGVAMPVGQPELIGTHPDYRRRGLVRAQFEVVHERGAASGHLWQYISGIPWYYRQFGYCYALDLPPRPVWWLNDSGPSTSGCTLRAARLDDVAFLARVEAGALDGPILSARRGEGGWELELRRRPGALPSCEVLVIELGPDPIGYLVHDHRPSHGELLSVRALELLPGHAWLDPTAAVLAHLRTWVGGEPAGRGVRFALPDGHSALRSASTRLGHGPGGPYGLYVRVPDVVAFVRAVASVLETRLATSLLIGFTGTIRFDLYTETLSFSFESGRLTSLEREASSGPRSDASLPLEAFLNLVLGNRGLADVERNTADCQINTDAGAALLEVLFPPLRLYAWEMG